MKSTLIGSFLVMVFASLVLANAFPAKPLDNPPELTIKQVLDSPQYLGSTVIVTGIFKGLGSKNSPPPVTRSDYVLEDTSGQIYVTGPLPPGITMKNIGQTITIKAKVRSTTLKLAGNKRKVIYLEVI